MPYGYGQNALISSSDATGSRQYTRMRGPVLLGQQESTKIAGMGSGNISPAHLVNVSSGPVDFINAATTFANANLVTCSSGWNVSTGTPKGIVYITMATGAGNLIAAGSTANVPTGLPGGQGGVGLVWDAAGATLAIFDPLSSAWLWPHQLGSSGNGAVITWSASSS